MKTLELFSGTKSFSKVAKEFGHKTLTVDFDQELMPDIVDNILEVTGKNPKVEWDNTKPTTIPFRMVSTERIEKELGFKPEYTFHDGIKETIAWYLNEK